MATAVLVGFIAIGAMNLTACDSVASGNRTNPSGIQEARGSVGDPIEIYDQDDLADIGVTYPADGDFILMDSFSLANWTPITESTPFTGTFDGNGGTITVSSFGTLSSQYIGIFATSGATAEFSNLTIILNAPDPEYNEARYVGGLVGYAEDTSFDTITVIGSLAVSTEIPPPPPPSRPNLALLPTAEPTDGFNVGGVAGYASQSTVSVNPLQPFTSITNYANITATSLSTAVFVGGVVGFANNSSIVSSVNSGNITGNGPGYNTSAGGIAGYIQSTTVSDSSSVGIIDLTGLGVVFDYTDTWQIYAGGLVGYSGGNAARNGGSLIERSCATGNVTAYAPYPYAGGLVGYNYGYMAYPDPNYNGSTVSQSYATGNVTATAQHDPNNRKGTIPYAGGLVGYSSVIDSRIEDSYATGNASATTDGPYAWVGGIVGGNASDSVVNHTYATGNVNSTTGKLPADYAVTNAVEGPAGGGIAGVNYSTVNSTVSNSVALNKLINTNNAAMAQPTDVARRVVGSLGAAAPLGVLSNNLANDGMTVNTYVTTGPIPGPNLRDGNNTSLPPPQADYDNLHWDFVNVWNYNGGYPTLQWQ
jgi:hypothetical protein